MVVQENLGNKAELLQFNSEEPSITEGISSRMVEQAALNRLPWISKRDYPKLDSPTIKIKIKIKQ